jgi:hypothetical protein
MNTLAKRFVIAAIASALIGMSLGIAIGLTGNPAFAPVHSHFSLLGWVSLSLFGLFYQCVPHAASGPLPQFQFYLSVLGSNLMAPTLAIPLLDYSSLQSALVVPGSLSIAGMLCFAAVVYRLKSHEGDTLAVMPTMEARTRRGVATLQVKPSGFQPLSDRC